MSKGIKGSDQACEHCDSRGTCVTYNDHLGGDSVYTIQQTFDFGGCRNFRIKGKTAKEALHRGDANERRPK